MRRGWWGAGIAALVVAIGLGGVVAARLIQGRADKAEKPVAALEFTPAEVATPLRAPMPERIEFSGPLTAPRTAVVRAKAAGTLLSLSVGEGSRVRAGQSLGTIDLADLQSRAADRAAGVDSAKARLAEAERIYQSNLDLANQKFISANALESSRAALAAARAQVRSAEAQYAASALGIRDAALVAPIAGLIGKKSVVVGEKVNAEQELLTVVDLKELELSGVVGTHQVAALKAGQTLQVRVEGGAEPVEGRIDRIAPSAEAGTRGIRVVVLVPNPAESFRAGQYASAVVLLADTTQRLTLPTGAIGQASGQDFVWTTEKGVLVRRLIVTGRVDPVGDRVEVIKGLAADARVIAARFDTLREGVAARVVGAPGAGAGTGAGVGASASAAKAS